MAKFMHGTPKGRIGWDDLQKIAKGGAIAAVGVVMAAVSQWTATQEVDLETTAWLAVAAFFSVAANGIRKLMTDTTTALTITMLAVSFCAGSVLADTVVVPISKTQGILIESDSTVSVERVKIANIGDTPIIDVPDKPPATGDRVAELRKVTQAIGDQQTASNLSGVMEAIAKKVRDGTLSDREAIENTLSTSLDFFLSDGRADTWKPWRELVNQLWLREVQSGSSLREFADLIDEISVGTAGDQALAALDLETITEIIEIISKSDLKPRDFIKIALMVARLFI